MHADAFFGAQQADFTGVHAAEGRHVDGHNRRHATVRRFRRHLVVFRTNAITPRRHLQITGPNPGVDADRTGNQIGAVLQAAVEPRPFHHNLTFVDLIAGDQAIFHLRLACSQRRAVGIDKAAAVTGNTGRISDNHLHFFTGNLHVTVEQTGIARIHFVEDHAGLAACQPRVAGDHAGQL